MKRLVGWASQHRSGLLLLLFLAVAAPFSPAITQIVAGNGLTGGGNGGSVTVALNAPVSKANGGTGRTVGPFDFGDGSDGAVTISSTITLTRVMRYTTLVVANGGTLNVQGFPVYGQISITVQNGGIIQGLGASASGSAGGVIGGQSSFYFGLITPASGTTTNGGNITCGSGLGGNGGNGGAGASGTGGTVTAFANTTTGIVADSNTLDFREFFRIRAASVQTAGCPGGGGGGNSTQTGGGGGGGASPVMLKSPLIDVQAGGFIQSVGGDGAAGTASNTGGGGGGGGGAVSLLYNTLTENGTVRSVAGHGGVSGGGSGVAGSDGTVGPIFRRQLP